MKKQATKQQDPTANSKEMVSGKQQEEQDNENYSKNFTRIPNIIFSSYKYLTKEEKFLYCTLREVYWDLRPRFLSTRDLSEATGYSRGALANMLPRLSDCGLIHAEIRREIGRDGKPKGNAKYHITIPDIWELNRKYFESSPEARAKMDPSLKLVHQMDTNSCPPNGQACPPNVPSLSTKCAKPVHQMDKFIDLNEPGKPEHGNPKDILKDTSKDTSKRRRRRRAKNGQILTESQSEQSPTPPDTSGDSQSSLYPHEETAKKEEQPPAYHALTQEVAKALQIPPDPYLEKVVITYQDHPNIDLILIALEAYTFIHSSRNKKKTPMSASFYEGTIKRRLEHTSASAPRSSTVSCSQGIQPPSKPSRSTGYNIDDLIRKAQEQEQERASQKQGV